MSHAIDITTSGVSRRLPCSPSRHRAFSSQARSRYALCNAISLGLSTYGHRRHPLCLSDSCVPPLPALSPVILGQLFAGPLYGVLLCQLASSSAPGRPIVSDRPTISEASLGGGLDIRTASPNEQLGPALYSEKGPRASLGPVGLLDCIQPESTAPCDGSHPLGFPGSKGEAAVNNADPFQRVGMA